MNKYALILCVVLFGVSGSIPFGWAHGNEQHPKTSQTTLESEPAQVSTTATHRHDSHDHAEHDPPTWQDTWLWMPPAHPMLVHFPIALLVIAGILGGMGLVRPSTTQWQLLRWTLYGSAVATLAALGSGLYFEYFVPHQHGGPIDAVMVWHERLGIATTVLTGVCALWVWRKYRHVKHSARVVCVLSIGLAVLTVLTSHLGGLLVHRFGVGL